MRKSAINNLTNKIKMTLLSFMIALLVIVSLPLNMLGGAVAEAVTAESTPHNNNVMTSATGTSVEVTVNYYRKDQNYTEHNWNIYMWNMRSGSDFEEFKLPFDADTIEIEVDGYDSKQWKTLKTTVPGVDLNEAKAIGVILRYTVGTNEWGWQTNDMHISPEYIVDGKVAIYLVDTIETIYYSAEDAMAVKFSKAYFSDFKTISFTTSQEIPENSIFVVKDSSGAEVATLPAVYTDEDEKKHDISGKRSGFITIKEFDITDTYVLSDEAEDFDKKTNFAPAITVSKTYLYDTDEFIDMYGYDGEDLGVEYSSTKSIFRVWSPIASEITLNLYNSGELTDTTSRRIPMELKESGVWETTVEENLDGKYYTYSVTIGAVTNEIVDPYARSGGRNGRRGMILNLKNTNPDGWDTQNIPDYGTTAKAISQAVIYEAHLRDLTIHESSGVTEANRGKFLGLTETGTKNSKGQATALDYIKSLGVTQVHFQPLFDFASVDESFTTATYNKLGEYNWGYDPLNYNMPEGSYSSDPADGTKRVNEMKQMIMTLHNAGIQVVMDVVYNHVSSAPSSNFEALVPGYFFRMKDDGGYYNGSGCGNETASERAMFRKFMIDSVKYWTEEYKIDGFRFDLMGLHDIDTMNKLYTELVKINPDVIVYGEGWMGDPAKAGISSTYAALKANANRMSNIAVFDDIVRDGLRGGVFEIQASKSPSGRGFMTGLKNMEPAVYVGAAGGTNVLKASKYLQIDASAFASNPTQNVNYVSAHDNSTLWDKMNVSLPADTTKAQIMAMYRMAAASVLTGQGASFFLAGEEMMRSKPTPATWNEDDGRYENKDYDNRPYAYRTDPTYTFSDNSYKSPDSVNAINWDEIDEDKEKMIEFYKGMIEIKKSLPYFHYSTRNSLRDNVFFVDDEFDDGVAQYMVKDPESDSYAIVMFNTNNEAKEVEVPKGEYKYLVNGDKASAIGLEEEFVGDKVTVGALSTVILVGEPSGEALYKFDRTLFAQFEPEAKPADDDGNLGLALGLGIGIPAAVLIAGGAVFGVMYGKKKKNKGEGESKTQEPEAGDKPDDADEPAEKAAEDEQTELQEATETPVEE